LEHSLNASSALSLEIVDVLMIGHNPCELLISVFPNSD
jgi:hypothetical protein